MKDALPDLPYPRECAGCGTRIAEAGRPAGLLHRLRDFLPVLTFRGGRYLADEFGRRPAARLDRKSDLVVPVPPARRPAL